MRNFLPSSKRIFRKLRAADGFTRSSTSSSSRNEKASREVVVGGADTAPSKTTLLPFAFGRRDGFTLLEMLVVVSVVTMLAGVMVVYSRTSENQIILFKEQAKAVNAFFQAKTRALQTFSENDLEKPCAYGIAFHRPTHALYLFKDIPTDFAECLTANQFFDGVGSAEVVSVIKLDSRVVISVGGTTFTEVLFTPPDPTTRLNNDPAITQVQLVLETPDFNTALGVKINDAGQITAFKPPQE